MVHATYLILLLGLFHVSTLECASIPENEIDTPLMTFPYELDNTNRPAKWSCPIRVTNGTKEKTCYFSTNHYANGEFVRKNCTLPFKLKQHVLTTGQRKDILVIMYSTNSLDLYTRIMDMNTCKFKDSKPIKRNVYEFTLGYQSLQQATLSKMKTYHIQFFFNDDDTFDAFIPYIPTCDGNACRVRYNMDGEVLEGPFPYLEKVIRHKIVFPFVSPINTSGKNRSYLIRTLTGEEFDYEISYFYFENDRLVTEIPVPMGYRVSVSNGTVVVCGVSPGNRYLHCNATNYASRKQANVTVELSDSLNPEEVQLVPEGGFLFIGNRCTKDSCKSKAEHTYFLKYFDADGRPGKSVRLSEMGCPENIPTDETAATFEGDNVCLGVLCKARWDVVGGTNSSNNFYKRKCIRKELIIGAA